MKYSIALYILALKEIYRKSRKLPSVAIILTSDEETGGYNGVNFLIEKGFRSDIALVPDGGENNCIVENAKGVIHLDIISTGKDAHGARLWEGKDSIEPLSKVIVALRKKYPFPSKKIWKTTINLGKFIAGIQTNQVASKALASIDVRYIPTEKPKEIIKSISKLTRGCYLKEDIHGVAFAIDRNNRFIKKWSKLLGARFINEDIASDGRYFVAKGIPTIVSKPIGGLIHNPGEWTSVKSCLNFGSVLEKFLTSSTK